ncbi:MAG TPA: ATP-binding protein [Firmicutes bacterium]|nr:ATP-binding protein [Candidatus Fermentithermobacillaceae bacterium]
MIDISLHLLDLLQNSAHAGASSISVLVVEDQEHDSLEVVVKDNGVGMDEREKELALDPFYSSSPGKRVGLGLPLVLQTAQMAGGKVSIESAPGSGTKVTVQYRLSHIDRQPLGDLASTLVSFMAGNPHVNICFLYKGPHGEFAFDSEKALQGIDTQYLGQVGVICQIEEKLREGLAKAGFKPDRGGLLFEVPRGAGTHQRGNPG